MIGIHAQIGTHILVDPRTIDPRIQSEMIQALTIPNPDKPAALREHIWGAQSMPDEIQLFYREGAYIRIPRGFVHSFIRGMQASGLEVIWQDERVSIERRGPELTPIALDPYQELACTAMLTYLDGLMIAPTGAGKTVISLEAIRRSKQRALIIVEKNSLAVQWIESIRELLGFEAGYIGESKWVEREITVVLRQALWAQTQRPGPLRMAEDAEMALRTFWERWGFVLLDEAHHAPADTLVDLMQRFPAVIRAGATATATRDPLTFPIAQAVIGPIVHETTFEEAEARLVRPRVRVIPTSFDFPDYYPTHKEKVWDAERGKYVTKTIRNNYGAMMAALIDDDERNTLICETVLAEARQGHNCLIVSSRREHLKDLFEKMMNMHEFDYNPVIFFTLFGGSDGKDATAIKEMMMASWGHQGTVLLSTVADEGLDIPKLDRVFLVFPSRKVGGTKQKVGRVTRRHPEKTDAIVFDFLDKQDLLKDQFRERRQMYYNLDGLEVEMPEGMR